MSQSHDNTTLIRRFYEAFDEGNGEVMAQCYAPDARFEDPVFGQLTGAEAGAMWRMFTSRPGSDLRVELPEHEADEEFGTANWIARYTFGPTGRFVVNDIRARFRFADGLVVDHVDRFSFWTWSRQAFGPLGVLLGWTPILRLLLRRRARADLTKFMRGKAVR
jgi:ketosteroid isomerase-like protein